jgi:hypothetical protein
VLALDWSADGRTLVSGSGDTTALVWDAARLPRAKPAPARQVGAEELRRLWSDLEAADAGTAHRAAVALGDAPRQALPLLAEKLRPAEEPKGTARLIADLGSNRFAVRQKAERELARLAEMAEPALRAALARKPVLEVRRRLERLLERIEQDAPAGKQLRALRAVEVLEQVGTPEARGLLKRLAGGAGGARLTREAKASLRRLDCAGAGRK